MELKKTHQQDKKFIEDDYKKKIAQLEADLATARQGFEAERQVLDKKRTDMQADYEKKISEMKSEFSSEMSTLKNSHSQEVLTMKSVHAKELEEETAQLRKEKEVIIADTVQKYEASIS